LIARAPTTIVASEMDLSIIINNLARDVSGITSVVLQNKRPDPSTFLFLLNRAHRV
jgi:hypothetical protein